MFDPILIQVTRSDKVDLDTSIIEDGQIVVTRYRELDGGPQRGTNVEDLYFRIGNYGDDTGGIQPGADSMGAFMLYATTSLSIAINSIEKLTGSYWTPWLMSTVYSPYQPFMPDSAQVVVATPDFDRNPTDFDGLHLGTKKVYYDGIGFDMRLTNGNIRALFNETLTVTESYENSTNWTALYNNTADATSTPDDPSSWVVGDGNQRYRKCYTFTNWSGLHKDSITGNIEAICFRGVPVNFAIDTDWTTPLLTLAKGTAFFADWDFTNTTSEGAAYHQIPGRITDYCAFKVNTLRNKYYDDVYDSDLMDNFYGLKIEDQNYMSVKYSARGIDLGILDATGVSGYYTYGMYMKQIGPMAQKSIGISMANVGYAASGYTRLGSAKATGISIGNVGHVSYTSDRGSGIIVTSVQATNSAYGLEITSVKYQPDGTYAYPLATGIHVGYVGKSTFDSSNITEAYTAAFRHRTSTTNNVISKNHFGVLVEYVDSTETLSGTKYLTGFAVRHLGDSTNGTTASKTVTGMSIAYLGQTSTANVYGFDVTDVTGAGNSAGLRVLRIRNTGASNIVGGVVVDDIYSAQYEAVGLNVSNIRSGGSTSISNYGLYVGAVYGHANNTARMHGVCVGDQLSPNRTFSAFSTGTIDSTCAVTKDVSGLYMASIGGTFAIKSTGMYLGTVGNTTVSTQTYGCYISNLYLKDTNSALGIGYYMGTMDTSANVDNKTSKFVAFFKDGQTDRTFQELVVFGSDSVYGIDVKAGSQDGLSKRSNIYGMKLGNLGVTNLTGSAYGIYLNSIGGYANGDGNSYAAAGFYTIAIGADTAKNAYGVYVDTITAGYGSSTVCAGIRFENVKLTENATGEYSYVCGMQLDNIESEVLCSAYGIKMDSISSGANAYGISLSSIAAVNADGYGILIDSITSGIGGSAYGIKINTLSSTINENYAIHSSTGRVLFRYESGVQNGLPFVDMSGAIGAGPYIATTPAAVQMELGELFVDSQGYVRQATV